jgi:hypothetical protein
VSFEVRSTLRALPQLIWRLGNDLRHDHLGMSVAPATLDLSGSISHPLRSAPLQGLPLIAAASSRVFAKYQRCDA